MADDLICVLVDPERGKWHVVGQGMKTQCGMAIPTGAQQRYLSLIDGPQRCGQQPCKNARITHVLAQKGK